MDNGQGPPFFNEDSMGPLHCKLHFYDTMALFIETLTGTCFELRVSPWEAVISVKAKIQRLEGIPISQQHLIWSNVELEDDYCLNDYNISEGSTLKLVLAMRDGPINIRKVPMEDPLREMAEYMEAGQDEVWERTYNKQVTFLVYREGEQLNFFRVVDRGDGTLTPVSESLSAGSVCNAYTDEEEEAEPSPSGQQVIENSITMKKMKLLRAKMETMHLSKQPKKAVQLKLGPPHAPPSPAGSRAAARHRPLRVLPDIRPSRLCPPGAASGAAASPAAPTAGGVPKRAGDQESNTPPRSTRSAQLPSRISQGESGHGREPSLPRRTKPLRGNLSPNHEGGPLLFPISEKCVTAKPRLPEVGSSSWTEGRADRPRGALEGTQTGQPGFLGAGGEEGLPAGELHPRYAAGAPRGPAEPAALGRPGPSPHKGRRLEPLRSPPKPQRQARPGSGRLQPSAPHGVLRALAVRGTTARLRAVKVDSPGKRSDVISKVEARDITEMANKASREPAGCVNNVGLLASLAQGAGRAGGLRASGPGQVQGERVRKGSPQLESADFLLAARGSGMSGNDPAAGKRAGECTHHLPPVQAPIQTKKKTAKHCFLCGKKTGLATSYECRCGNNFCASHRYAETHGCTYDYKSAGRRYLQDANPVVNAPKLPKI